MKKWKAMPYVLFLDGKIYYHKNANGFKINKLNSIPHRVQQEIIRRN